LLEAERDLAVALSSTSDLKFALERLLEIATRLQGVDCAGIYLAEGESSQLQLKACRGLPESLIERSAQLAPDGTESRLAQAGRVLYLRQDQIPRQLEVLWGAQGLRALLVVPLQHKGATLGMLNIASYHDDEISPETRMGIEIVASQMAGAIGRIQAEEALRRSDAHLRSLITSAPLVLLATDAQGRITFEDGRALAAMDIQPGEHLHQLALEVYRDFPLMLDNLQRAMAGEEVNSNLEFGANVFECRYVPLHDKNGLFAGLVLVATDVTERARLQREILEISDREQARIGQDIHDGLCQQLIGMAFSANSLAQNLTAEQRPEASPAQKICTLLDEAITESRRVSRGLYPVRLKTEGLVPALEELARTVAERYHVACEFQPSSRHIQCQQSIATHLYRIAQEAINNAVKHSGTPKISIALAQAAGGLELNIEDFGTAAPKRPGPLSGMGLHIMEYRARTMGGTLQVIRGASGTTVTCRVPQRTSGLTTEIDSDNLPEHSSPELDI
jgi:two-component system, LuxR family, sensor kinase FixL